MAMYTNNILCSMSKGEVNKVRALITPLPLALVGPYLECYSCFGSLQQSLTKWNKSGRVGY